MKFHDPKRINHGNTVDDESQRLYDAIYGMWINAGAEYYKIYPAIIPSLLRLPSDVNTVASIEVKPRSIGLRFAVGNEPTAKAHRVVVDDGRIGTKEVDCYLEFIHLSTHPQDGRQRVVLMSRWRGDQNKATLREHHGSVVMYWSDKASVNDVSAGRSKLWDACRAVELKTAAFVMMLEGDKSIVSPEVLSRDAHKWDAATESERSVMVARARRRGKIGFSIGREYESMPHFRRPHFAIRHTGKGGAIPKIVPVKASVVHRDTITRVPTGHYDQNWNEVEPKQ